MAKRGDKVEVLATNVDTGADEWLEATVTSSDERSITVRLGVIEMHFPLSQQYLLRAAGTCE